MKQTVRRTAAILCPAVLLLGVSGCKPAQDPAEQAQKQQSDRLLELTNKSGGDWNRLTPDDQKYMIDVIGKGDAGVAHTVLQMNVPHTAPHGRPNLPGGGK